MVSIVVLCFLQYYIIIIINDTYKAQIQKKEINKCATGS